MSTRTLNRAPSMLGLYAKAAAPLIPGAAKLPGLPGGGGSVPDIELLLEGAEVDRGQLDGYCQVCGFESGAALPPSYPHILAFPLHMALMTDSRFPFGPVGLVHIENEITQHRPLSPCDRLSFTVSATQLEPHAKGKTFAIVTDARVRGELVWQERSTMLRRGKGDPNAARGSADAGDAGGSSAKRAEWKVPGDTGRRYAAASGDRNPIHMHPLTAKAFGFPRAIAHGMWAKARCLAELEPELPEAFTVAVGFRKPILLPATVEFASDGNDFSLRNPESGALHLTGRITTDTRSTT